MIVHTREKSQLCQLCAKSFSETSTLRNHMLTHTGEKQHIFMQCTKEFNRASTLRKHMLTHTVNKEHMTISELFKTPNEKPIEEEQVPGQNPEISSSR